MNAVLPAPSPADRVMLGVRDFEVESCVAHFYQKPNGWWWWHCLSCNTSTQIRKHGNGHRTSVQAREGMTDHVNQVRLHKQRSLWKDWWNSEIDSTDDPEWFRQLWEQYFPDWNWREHEVSLRESMLRAQAGRRRFVAEHPG